MKSIQLNPILFRFVNPCAQLNTSGNAIFQNKLNLSQNVEPKFCKECTHVYEDTDMMYQDYDPTQVQDPESAQNAENFNESLKISDYGKTA